MIENLQGYIDELNKKNNLLIEIFNYIKNKDFKTTQDEVEYIENYILKRKKLFIKLEDFDYNLKVAYINYKFKNNQIAEIIEKNDDIIKKIIKEDEKQTKILQDIMTIIKSEIKKIRQVGQMNNNYNSIYNIYSSGNYFDNKR